MKVMVRRSISALVVVVCLLAVSASAASAVTITGGAFTGTATTAAGSLSFVPNDGSSPFTCKNAQIKGTTTGTNSVGITGGANNTYTNCTADSIGSISVTTAGTWTLTATSLTSGTITIPNGAAKINVTVFGDICTETVNAASIAVNWTNTSKSLEGYAGNSIPFVRTGSSLCPPSGNATFQFTYHVPTVSVT